MRRRRTSALLLGRIAQRTESVTLARGIGRFGPYGRMRKRRPRKRRGMKRRRKWAEEGKEEEGQETEEECEQEDRTASAGGRVSHRSAVWGALLWRAARWSFNSKAVPGHAASGGRAP
eukprot:6702115-Pyramimonas_sp.AAC.1